MTSQETPDPDYNNIYIHGMQPIILGFFFSNNYDGNKYISFQDLHDPKG